MKTKTETDPDWLILANKIRATRSAISIDIEINPDWLVYYVITEVIVY